MNSHPTTKPDAIDKTIVELFVEQTTQSNRIVIARIRELIALNQFSSSVNYEVILCDPQQMFEILTKRSNQLALPDEASTAATTSSNIQYAIPLDENDHRYVGLVNQAMTCYLNSLVQSLYMTPEFRNAMYEWEFVQHPAHAKEQKKKAEQSIPCQLQKLFLLLQTTDNDSLETKDLTQSFGWTSNEAYDQHDVQELCRLMFDALEHKWKGTKHEKLIQDLYRGTMEDFVACLKCGRESVKTDYFLDLSLTVKPSGAIHAYKSIEEALNAFIQPELLDGSNKYMCENCKSKQDAHKGLRITQFPYLLTIQLKRFDMDCEKLNDKMTFPDVLDLNKYIKEKRSAPTVAPSTTSPPAWKTIPPKKPETEDDMELGSPNPKRCTPGNQSPNRYSYRGDENVVVGQPIDQKAVESIIKTSGDNVYELFSVMVHSGNAAGGHYFAYIKNLDQDRWYVFNDTRVDFASTSEIEKCFGGHPSGCNQSNTNAYMLMYRKIDPKRNANFILSNKLPRHIRDSQEKADRDVTFNTMSAVVDPNNGKRMETSESSPPKKIKMSRVKEEDTTANEDGQTFDEANDHKESIDVLNARQAASVEEKMRREAAQKAAIVEEKEFQEAVKKARRKITFYNSPTFM